MQISTLHFLSPLQQQKDFTHTSADALAVPWDRERKGQGGFPAVQKHPGMQHLTLCIQKLTILLSSTSPTPSKSGFSPSFLDSETTHISSMCHCPAEETPAPEDWKDGDYLQLVLEPGLSLVFLIQPWASNRLGTPVPQWRRKIIWSEKERNIPKDYLCTQGTSRISYNGSEVYINVPLTIG